MIGRKQRQTVVQGIHNPQGIAVFKGKLYYAQPEYETLSERDINSGTLRVLRRNILISRKLQVFYQRHSAGVYKITHSVMYSTQVCIRQHVYVQSSIQHRCVQ